MTTRTAIRPPTRAALIPAPMPVSGICALAFALAAGPVFPASEAQSQDSSDVLSPAIIQQGIQQGQPTAAQPFAPATSTTPAIPAAPAIPVTPPRLEGSLVPLAPLERLDPLAASASAVADPTADPAKNPEADAGKPITMTFRDAGLAAVLESFAAFTGLNIVLAESVRGTVSIRLKDVPWRRAFDTLLDVHGLAMQRRGNVIWVAPAAELAGRQRLRLEAHARVADLEPLATRSFELHFQRAGEVQKMLAGGGAQRLLSKRGMALADSRTNRLFVTDLAQRLEQIETMLAIIDRPARQVMIEARIVEADQSFSRNLGVRLALQGAGARDGGQTPPAGQMVDLPAGPLSGFPAAALGLGLFGAGAARVLTLELSALETEGRGRILSNPRVVTADRVKALIEQGTELPYQAKVGNGVSAVQFRRAGLKLEVEPHITPDGQVVLDLDIAKDSVGVETVSGPAINTKHIQTRVQVENGGTVVIGGIYTEDERKDGARVPWVGRLPLIGALFRNQASSDRKSELLVFITPSVVSASPGPASKTAFEASVQTISPGTAENRPTPLRLIDPAAQSRQGSTKHVISP